MPTLNKTRITSIKLSNCRAFLGDYDLISLAEGQNLLIYGENGSGKSSLFKAFSTYFSKSIDDAVPFVKNRYNEALPGKVELEFSSFTPEGKLVESSAQSYTFGSLGSDNTATFIRSAALTKGFLDYSNLLDVYLHKEQKPNLFGLIALSLLSNQYPTRSGGDFTFKSKWNDIQRDLIDRSRTRNDRNHKRGIQNLGQYHTHLSASLSAIFQELNRLLGTYFPDLNISLGFDFPPFVFKYGPKWQWHTDACLYLKVFKDGIEIVDGYRDMLNEARLSAFAICLYLASLKENPRMELRVIYLDDVFIGLDAGNRLPILDILTNEFADYQIFISTYDRHWFELARRRFSMFAPDNWKSIEFYVGVADHLDLRVSYPIAIQSEEYYDKAVRFLHDRANPDYPAAANYFRKALEELLSSSLPKWEIVDAEFTQLPDYQLTSLCLRAKAFLNRIGLDSRHIDEILTLLSSLLHPLSHHQISSQIYKNELDLVEKSISKLKHQLGGLDITNNFRCALEQGKRIRFTFEVNAATNHYCYYELLLREPITLKWQDDQPPFVCPVACFADKFYGNNGDQQYKAFNPSRKDPRFSYSSLAAAYDVIHNYLIGLDYIGHFPKPGDILTHMHYHDGVSWLPLADILKWPELAAPEES